MLRLLCSALVCYSVLALASPTLSDCPVPTGFVNQTTRTENGLRHTFALDHFVYPFMTSPIRFHYIVENVGTDLVSLSFHGSPQNMFAIYPASCAALNQVGCYEGAIYFNPQLYALFGIQLNLLPGECRAYAATWWQDPNRVEQHQPGTYRAFAGLWQPTAGGNWPGEFIHGSGLSVNLSIDMPVAASSTTWGRVKALYR